MEHTDCGDFSRMILDHDFPLLSGPVVVDHYTEGPAFWSIVQTEEFRLSQVASRLTQGELATFAWEHGLRGYVNVSEGETEFFRAAAKDLFFGSFTPRAPRKGTYGSIWRQRQWLSPEIQGQSCSPR